MKVKDFVKKLDESRARLETLRKELEYWDAVPPEKQVGFTVKFESPLTFNTLTMPYDFTRAAVVNELLLVEGRVKLLESRLKVIEETLEDLEDGDS